MILKPKLFRKLNLRHPLARGLVSYWLMNEGAGNIIQDLSGNGNHGALASGLIWVPGKFGPAISFPGEQMISITVDGVTAGTSHTLIFWIQTSTPRRIFDCETGRTIFDINDGGTIQYYDGGWNAGEITVTDGLWHQVVASVSGGTDLNLYVDGVLDTQHAVTASAIGGAAQIGEHYEGTGSEQFLGLIGMGSIYNVDLSASEIAQLYREPFTMFAYDPAELWVGSVGAGAPPVGNAGIMTTNTGFWGPTL